MSKKKTIDERIHDIIWDVAMHACSEEGQCYHRHNPDGRMDYSQHQIAMGNIRKNVEKAKKKVIKEVKNGTL